jgi:hypothetical protein
MKKGVSWDVTPSGSCKNRRFGGLNDSIIRVTRIGELGTKLALTSNRRCSYFTDSCHLDYGGPKFLRNLGSYKSHAA